MKTLRPDLGHSHAPTALKNPPCHFAWLAALVVFLLNAQAWSQSSAFTYQGHLMDGGISANGNYDLQFSLQNSLTGGATIGVPQVVAPVTVTNGIFSVTLDFGAAVFDGSDRWVEIAVRPAGSIVAYTVLAPRQRITSNPYAIRAANAATATNASHLTGALSSSNVPAGFVTGAMIANGAVDSQQIAPHAVTSSQVADGAIGATQMADYAVTAGKLRLGTEAGTEANGALNVTSGILTFSHAFAYPFATAPAVTLLSPVWSPPVVDATAFAASISVAPVTLDAVNDTGTSASLAIVNGNPAASYYDAASGDLKFVRALDPQGHTWSPPLMIASLGDVGRSSSLTVVNGFPAIAFIDDTAHQLRFARALDASGNSWSAPVTVIASVNATDVSLIVANNQPAIGFHDSGAHTMAYVRAADANGTAWGITVVVDNDGDTGIYATAALVAGAPALAYWENGGEVRFARASDADGSAWTKPIVVDATPGLGRRVSLAVINGMPAISFADTSNNAIRYVRGLDEHGDSWSTPVDAVHGVAGATAVLTAFTGTPAIAFYESGASDLVLTLASDASDASAMTWSTPVHLDATGNVGAGASIVPVSGGLGISYDQTTNGDLKYIFIPELRWQATDGTTAPIVAANVTNGAINSAQLALNAVLSANIASGAVGNTQLAANSVQSGNIASGAVGTTQLASNAVQSGNIASGAIGNAQLAVNAVQANNIAGGAVGTAQLANGAVGNAQLSANAVQSNNIAIGAVGTAQIATNAVQSGNIAIGAVGFQQLASGAVHTSNIAAGAVGATELGAFAVHAGNIASGAVGFTQLAPDAVHSSNIAFGAVDAAALAPGVVGFTSLAKPPQAGTVDGATLTYDFTQSYFTVTFPQAYSTPPVVTLSLAPTASTFTEQVSLDVVGVSATQFTARVHGFVERPVIVELNPRVRVRVSLAQVNGRPAVSYLDYDYSDPPGSGGLVYLRASDANGGSWDYQARQLLGTGHSVELPAQLGNNLLVINGKPSACYSSFVGVEFLHGNDADGTTWAPLSLPGGAPGDGKSYRTSMAIVNGNPAICWFAASPPNTALLYSRATNVNGTAWSSGGYIAGGDFGATSMAAVNGRPAICFIDRSTSQLKYLRSNDAIGTTWPGTGITLAGGVNYDDIALLVVNGRPSVAFYDETTGDLKYMRADDADGTTWGAEQTLDSADKVGVGLSMAIINGTPAISYADATNNAIKYVRARDADGGVWGIPVRLESSLSAAVGYQTSLAAINGAPAIGYIAEDGVRYVRHTDPDTHFKINWIAIPP